MWYQSLRNASKASKHSEALSNALLQQHGETYPEVGYPDPSNKHPYYSGNFVLPNGKITNSVEYHQFAAIDALKQTGLWKPNSYTSQDALHILGRLGNIARVAAGNGELDITFYTRPTQEQLVILHQLAAEANKAGGGVHYDIQSPETTKYRLYTHLDPKTGYRSLRSVDWDQYYPQNIRNKQKPTAPNVQSIEPHVQSLESQPSLPQEVSSIAA